MFYDGEVVRHEHGAIRRSRIPASGPVQANWICVAAGGIDGGMAAIQNPRHHHPALTDYEALDVVTMNATWFVARPTIRGRALGRAEKRAGRQARRQGRARAEEANVGRGRSGA